MGNLRKLIASLGVVAILSTLVVTTASAGTFGDVPADEWYASYVESLVDLGVVDDANANFYPAKDLNRAEAVKLVVVAADLECDTPTEATFTDVASGAWYYEYVECAASHGVVTGYGDGKFGPNDKLTREQWAKIVVEAFDLPVVSGNPGFSDWSGVSTWAKDYVATAWSYNVVDGYADGTFGGGKNVNKAESAKMVSVGIDPGEPRELPVAVGDDDDDDDVAVGDDDDDDTGEEEEEEEEEEEVVGGGDLEVSINADTPSVGTIPANATSVPFVSWDFKAGDGGAEIGSLTVHKIGVSALHASHLCYLYDGDDRLTSGRAVNSTSNNLTFSSLNYSVQSGGTATLLLKCDVNATAAAGEAGFELVDAAAVDAGESTVTGDFPISSDLFSLSTTSAGTVTIVANGDVAEPKVGEDDVMIAKFKISAATEDASLEKFGLYVGAGNISTTDLQNFELYVSGTDDAIATVEGVNSKDVAMFVLDTPYEIEKGADLAFTVKVDLNSGRSADTIQAFVDETTDVVAIGATYGFGMNVTMADYDGATSCTAALPTDCTHSTVQGGDVTVTSSGPAATQIGTNGKDIVLMDFTIATAGDVTFKNFPISLDMSETAATDGLLDTTTSNITDIKIGCGEDNETVWGPIDATSLKATSITTTTAITEAAGDDLESFYLFTEEKVFSAGDEVNCKLTADIRNLSTLADETIVASLELTTTHPEIRDANNKVLTNSTSLVPSANLQGKTMTIGAPSLTLSLASVPITGQTEYVKGQANVKFVGVSAQCGSASDCKIKDITLTGDIDENGGADGFLAGIDTVPTPDVNLNSIVGSVWLEDSAGNVVAAAKPVQSTGAVNFTSVNWTIEGGDTELFYVVGNVSTNGFSNSDEDEVSFGINAASDVTFEDSSGTSTNATNTINAANEVYVSVIGGGSLTVTVDSGTANENILVAGAADQTISKFKFTTTKEAFLVKKLSVNAKQTVLTSANNDNNIANVKISYTNSDGVAETKSGTVTSGTVQFSGMDFYIDKDSDAALTITASTNEIVEGGGGSTAGEFIDLNVAFNNFEAIAQSSGDTYGPAKIDSAVAATSDLDFGTITWTAADCLLNDADHHAVTAPGTSTTIVVDTCGTNIFPVGTLIMAGADATWTDNSDSIFVLTSISTATAMTMTVLDDDDAELANNIALYYSSPGTGYLTTTNRMYIYKTLPALALGANAPSGSKTLSPTDTIFEITVTPNAKDDVVIRQGLAGDDENAGFGMDANGTDDYTITTAAGNFIDGAGGFLWTTTADSITDEDCFILDEVYTAGTAEGALGSYKYMSFWIKSNQADIPYNDFGVIVDITGTPANGSCAPAVANQDEIQLTDTAGSIWVNGTAMTTDTLLIGNGGTANYWDLVTVDISAMTSNATAVSVGFTTEVTAGAVITAGDLMYIDGVTLHNEMLVVDLAGNAVFNVTPTTIVDCTLKKGTAAVASVAAGVQTTSQARVLIVPENNITGTDYADIVMTKGSANTYSLVCDSQSLITQSVNDDNLTPSIDYGSSVDGTVTRGDFWWSAEETTKTLVYWLGNVGTKLSGNTLKY